MNKIEIKTENINLDQFLKWANLVGTGGEAKVVIQAGKVKVNGEVVEKRAKTLSVGDTIEYRGTSYQVTSS
ncbi:RNA-binding S4 domain-containing protein [Halanaerobaculum tunisiense]